MRATRDELPVLFGSDPAAIRGADWGDLRAMIISLPAGTDLAPLLQGLPGDLRPCPHWGVEFSRPAEHQPVLDHVARAAASGA